MIAIFFVFILFDIKLQYLLMEFSKDTNIKINFVSYIVIDLKLFISGWVYIGFHAVSVAS